MPLPKPHSGETEDDFIGRCMGDETMMADFEDNDQRLAVCFGQWREVHGGEPPKSKEGDGFKSVVALEITNEDRGEVEAVFARYKTVDMDGEYVLPGAFEDGAPVRISAHEHTSWGNRGGRLAVGRGIIKTTESDARLVGHFFMNTSHGRDHFETVKGLGELQQWSYHLRRLEKGPPSPELEALGVRQVLKKLYVHEVSPAFEGASVGTHTVSLKSYDAMLRREEEKLEELKAREAELAEQRERIEEEYFRFARTRRRLGF